MATSAPLKSTPQKKNSTPKRSLWFITTFAMLLALAALMMTWQLTQTLQEKTKAFDAALIMLNGQQINNEARLEAQYAKTEETQATWQAKLDNLDNTLQITRKEYSNLSDDWRLLKVRHLLELAALNAHWSTDKDTTIAMLREADAFLTPIHNPKLVDVQKGLAHDITEQQTAPSTDVTALLIQLNAIQAATFHLPVMPLPTEAFSENIAEKSTPAHTFTKIISNLIVIRHTSEVLEPQHSLAYEAMLRATVRLNLQEAVWGILERNDTIYHAALTQAITNLEHTFSSKATSTQAVIERIKQLKTTPLRTDPMIPEQGLTALNQLMTEKTHHD